MTSDKYKYKVVILYTSSGEILYLIQSQYTTDFYNLSMGINSKPLLRLFIVREIQQNLHL